MKKTMLMMVAALGLAVSAQAANVVFWGATPDEAGMAAYDAAHYTQVRAFIVGYNSASGVNPVDWKTIAMLETGAAYLHDDYIPFAKGNIPDPNVVETDIDLTKATDYVIVLLGGNALGMKDILWINPITYTAAQMETFNTFEKALTVDPWTPNVVPEPSTSLLAVIGLGILALRRRVKKA